MRPFVTLSPASQITEPPHQSNASSSPASKRFINSSKSSELSLIAIWAVLFRHLDRPNLVLVSVVTLALIRQVDQAAVVCVNANDRSQSEDQAKTTLTIDMRARVKGGGAFEKMSL